MTGEILAFVLAALMAGALHVAGSPLFHDRFCALLGAGPGSAWFSFVSVRLSQLGSGFTVAALVVGIRLLCRLP